MLCMWAKLKGSDVQLHFYNKLKALYILCIDCCCPPSSVR
ncbi:hypothetical protein B4107_1877 [Bacillus safensis]|nr:hypothetical protein B4107_1877 [Bacillus safensis]